MKTFLRNLGALLLGLVAGSVVNMGLILLSGKVIPPPAGADVTTMEGLKAAIPLFEPRHFLFPFLAHALGTLAGATVTAAVSTGRRLVYALGVGAFFLAGGVANAFVLPGPLWFILADLCLAYLPMAWLGSRIAARPTKSVP